MLHFVSDVQALDNYLLQLEFDSKESKIFDLKPYLDMGVFKELKNISLFRSVNLAFDSIQWSNKADLSPEFLYRNSTPA